MAKANRSERSITAFKVGFKSDFYPDYVRLFDDVPKRSDRISVVPFREKIFRGVVRYVERDSKQQPIAKGAQYSVIDRLSEDVT